MKTDYGYGPPPPGILANLVDEVVTMSLGFDALAGFVATLHAPRETHLELLTNNLENLKCVSTDNCSSETTKRMQLVRELLEVSCLECAAEEARETGSLQ